MFKTSESVKEIMPAMIIASSEIILVNKDRSAGRYRYATLDNIMAELKPILAKNNLCIIQGHIYENQTHTVETMVYHSSGEYIGASASCDHVALDHMNPIQSIGSIITYLRRYSISAMLGIASEDDADAQGSQKKLPNKLRDTKNRLHTVIGKKFKTDDIIPITGYSDNIRLDDLYKIGKSVAALPVNFVELPSYQDFVNYVNEFLITGEYIDVDNSDSML